MVDIKQSTNVILYTERICLTFVEKLVTPEAYRIDQEKKFMLNKIL